MEGVKWVPPTASMTTTVEQDAARRALPRWQQQQNYKLPAVVTTTPQQHPAAAVWTPPAARLSNNLDRLFLQSHAAQIVAAERSADLAAMRPTAYPAAGAAAVAAHGPPHRYGSLAEDPVRLHKGDNIGPTIANLERLRAIQATAGPSALLPPPMAQHVSDLVDAAAAARR